jgi:hypothetical protein
VAGRLRAAMERAGTVESIFSLVINSVAVAIGLIVVGLAACVGTAVIAHNKGRSAVGWFFIALVASLIVPLGGVIALLVVAFMQPLAKTAPSATTPAPPA